MNPDTTKLAIVAVPWVVVTGASEGIGLHIAHRFAALGRDVILIARGEERLRAAASAIADRHGVRALPVALDVTAVDAAARIASAADEAGGFVDVLVNNAGVGLSGRFDAAPTDHIAALLDLNVCALTALSRHFLPGMRARRRGGILNIASLAGYTPGPWQAVYYASKAYVISLSEALAAEVAADRVRVTVVVPGPIVTRFHDKMGALDSYYRFLLPMPGPESIAHLAVFGYRLGLRLIVPDIWGFVMMPFLRILPHRLTVPIVGWLLRPRRHEVEDA